MFPAPRLGGVGEPLPHPEGGFMRTCQAAGCAQCVSTGPSAELSLETGKAIRFSAAVLRAPHSQETLGTERGSVPSSLEDGGSFITIRGALPLGFGLVATSSGVLSSLQP